MTNFHVGQKVVCIKSIPDGCSEYGISKYEGGGGVWPEAGVVYTVTGIWSHPQLDRVSLYLGELRNPEMRTAIGWLSPPFDSASFRPVIGRKTSISIFTDMLKTQRTGVRA